MNLFTFFIRAGAYMRAPIQRHRNAAKKFFRQGVRTLSFLTEDKGIKIVSIYGDSANNTLHIYTKIAGADQKVLARMERGILSTSLDPDSRAAKVLRKALLYNIAYNTLPSVAWEDGRKKSLPVYALAHGAKWLYELENISTAESHAVDSAIAEARRGAPAPVKPILIAAPERYGVSASAQSPAERENLARIITAADTDAWRESMALLFPAGKPEKIAPKRRNAGEKRAAEKARRAEAIPLSHWDTLDQTQVECKKAPETRPLPPPIKDLKIDLTGLREAIRNIDLNSHK